MMVRITIDQELGLKLAASAGAKELCDGTGRVIGHFIPCADVAEYEKLTPPTSVEELERRQREEPGRPLREILRDLGNHR